MISGVELRIEHEARVELAGVESRAEPRERSRQHAHPYAFEIAPDAVIAARVECSDQGESRFDALQRCVAFVVGCDLQAVDRPALEQAKQSPFEPS